MSSQKYLNIAMFIDDFYPASGGIARSTQTQIGELVKNGHNVTLFAPKHQLEPDENLDIVPISAFFYIPGGPSHTCILRHDRALAKKISKKYSFDVVHSQTERGGLVLAARIANLQRIPHVHTFHANFSGTHVSQPFSSFLGSMAYLLLLNPLFSLAAKKRNPASVRFPKPSPDAPNILARFDWHTFATIASRVDAFTAPAPYMIQLIGDCSDGLGSRGSVIQTGVSPIFSEALNSMPPKEDSPKVLKFLSVCRLAPEKRVDVLIKAFIDSALPNSELDIVGTGNQEATLRKMAAPYKNIRFHSHLNNSRDIARFYHEADVFVLASYRFDTQAITIAEAVTAGLPVIYCDERLSVGVSTKNSILTRSPDIKDFTAAYMQIANKSLRESLAEQSRIIAPSLTPQAMANQYEALYRSLQRQK